MDNSFESIPLGNGYSMRASRLVYQNGVGGMTDFLEQTLMTAAPEFWADSIKKIYDQRLQNMLKVDYFGLLKGRNEAEQYSPVRYVRFPEWYFCPNPKCRKFKPLCEWTKDYIRKNPDESYMTKPVCSKCHQALVPTRLVTVCEHGHIDDFPWIEWVHAKSKKEICQYPSLKLLSGSSANEGIAGQKVVCEYCGAETSLKGALDHDIFEKMDQSTDERFNFRCNGRHPWKNVREACGLYPVPMQRGASSVYFPVLKTSLVIPPYSSELNKLVQESDIYNEYIVELNGIKKALADLGLPKDVIMSKYETVANDYAIKISDAFGKDTDRIKDILTFAYADCDDEDDDEINTLKYKFEEYEALSGEVSVPKKDNGDFKREAPNVSEYQKDLENYPYLSCIKQVALIHKIREIQALVGYTRLSPIDNESFANKDNMVSIKQPNTNWYPAYEVRGEGIFIEFDIDQINRWRTNNNEMESRAQSITERFKKSYFGRNSNKKITSKFLLLHTISHLLIKELSFNCGYNIASLKERIYCSELIDGKEMTGILIYTASGDTEGTLGGLVRQGRPDVFPSVFCKAIDSARNCSNDPVCSISNGQGRDSLNLAACYSCTLIPETSCEESNVFLDRAAIVGVYGKPELGFFENKYDTPSIGIETSKKSSNNTDLFFKCDDATLLKDYSYDEIFEGIYPENDTEQRNVDSLIENASKFNGLERPYQNCPFLAIDDGSNCICDFYWKKANVALFSSYNKDYYVVAKNASCNCFITSDKEFSYTQLLDMLRED